MRSLIARIPHMLYGADYNPEQWPPQTWADDARLMRDAGINLVSLGIFAWAQLEPQPGVYTFDWLDRVMEILYSHGVSVNLSTATASPPPWLAARHPESLPVTREGVTLWPGGRQAFCPSSAAYRTAASALARHIAMRYRDHPALAMWHIGNEYADHIEACYCDASAAAFRVWLQRRYSNIERLNDAWGTAFWSQRYDDWSEINPPRAMPAPANPTQQLDFNRFSSDELLACFLAERAILHELTPQVPVTTNFMYSNKALDYWTWAAYEEIVSYDSYGDPSRPETTAEMARSYDLMRSLGSGQPWIVMEQTPSLVNWRPYNVVKRPGQMRLWSFQAIARGADGIMFFQWRASKAGVEKFHGAIIGHAGADEQCLAHNRVWREIRGLGAELAALDVVLGARTPAQVAILLDYESWWALETDSKPSEGVRMIDQVRRYYAWFYAHNIAVDFVRPDVDLSAYRVLLAPNLYLVRGGVAARIGAAVSGGSTLVMSFFSGIADENDHILLGGYPAPFRALLGLSVEEFDPYVPGQTNRIVAPDGRIYGCDLWGDVIALEGAEAIAAFMDDFYGGRAAVTRYAYGRGSSYYLGTRPDDAYMDALLTRVCAEAGVGPPLDAPAGVEVAERINDAGSFLFVLNHTTSPTAVTLRRPGHDLLSGAACAGTIVVEACDVVVVQEE